MKLIDLIQVTSERDIDLYSFDHYFLLRCSSTTFELFHPYLSDMEVENIYPSSGGTLAIRIAHSFEYIKDAVHEYFNIGEENNGEEKEVNNS